MVRPGALPIGEQVLLDLLVPPAVTAIWWLLAGGWSALLGTSDSSAVMSWKKPATWMVLAICYVVAFSVTLCGYFL